MDQTSVLERPSSSEVGDNLPFGLVCEERHTSVAGTGDLVWMTPTGEYVEVDNRQTTEQEMPRGGTIDIGQTSGFFIFTDSDVYFD